MESNINKYKLEQNGKEYALTTSILGNRLRLSCKNVVNQYIKFTRDFTLEDLKQLDKIFNVLSTPYQALEYFDNILKNDGAEVVDSKDWSKRRFAYEIGGFTEGVYHIVNIKAENADAINEFDRLAKINDGILRHMIVKRKED